MQSVILLPILYRKSNRIFYKHIKIYLSDIKWFYTQGSEDNLLLGSLVLNNEKITKVVSFHSIDKIRVDGIMVLFFE